MIAALILLAAQPVAEAAPAASNDIVVIGHKVRKIRFRLNTDKSGKAICRIKRSSGDAEIDRLACDAARPCVRPDIVTTAAMTACLEPRWAQLAAQVAASRRNAR